MKFRLKKLVVPSLMIDFEVDIKVFIFFFFWQNIVIFILYKSPTPPSLNLSSKIPKQYTKAFLLGMLKDDIIQYFIELLFYLKSFSLQIIFQNHSTKSTFFFFFVRVFHNLWIPEIIFVFFFTPLLIDTTDGKVNFVLSELSDAFVVKWQKFALRNRNGF